LPKELTKKGRAIESTSTIIRDDNNRISDDEETLRLATKNFHKEPLEKRVVKIKKLLPDLNVETLNKGGLSPSLADYMIENCIGIMPLPLGLGIGFKVNDKNYLVPMAVEEPSVIAACSAIAKIISTHGTGF